MGCTPQPQRPVTSREYLEVGHSQASLWPGRPELEDHPEHAGSSLQVYWNRDSGLQLESEGSGDTRDRGLLLLPNFWLQEGQSLSL